MNYTQKNSLTGIIDQRETLLNRLKDAVKRIEDENLDQRLLLRRVLHQVQTEGKVSIALEKEIERHLRESSR